MQIQISDKYRITSSDALNITVEQLAKPKGDKEPGWRAVGYFGKLEQALTFVLNRDIAASEATTLTGLKNDIQATREAMCAALRASEASVQVGLGV